ncbi:hypothetical protein JB92DRAFT_2838720 [Gautieria morchelliformis]|nr:hypothetical protein JB92DRAFT_2838720 [Gautieria morchelliformis]
MRKPRLQDRHKMQCETNGLPDKETKNNWLFFPGRMAWCILLTNCCQLVDQHRVWSDVNNIWHIHVCAVAAAGSIRLVLQGTATSSGTNELVKTRRTNVVIGICAASTGIAAIVTIWWMVWYMWRKEEAKHHRLSELRQLDSRDVYGTPDDDWRTNFYA